MMTYSVCDIIGGSMQSQTDNRFTHKYVQFVNEADDSGYVNYGDLLATINIYQGTDDNSVWKKIELKAPNKGYYLLCDTNCFCERIYDYNPKQPLYNFYEDLGDNINDGEDHFIDSYNTLLPELSNYYNTFIYAKNTAMQYSSYKCDYKLGFPVNDERPLDFMEPLDWILNRRKRFSEKSTIIHLDYLQDIVSKTTCMYHVSFMIFQNERKILIWDKLLAFKDIIDWIEDEISYSIKYHEIKDNKPHTCIIVKQSQSACYIQRLKKIIRDIIKANKIGDYSNIDLRNLEPHHLPEYSYTFRNLMKSNDLKWINHFNWEMFIANDFDIAYSDDENDQVVSHYFENGETLVKLVRSDGGSCKLFVNRDGYYHIDIPPIIFPVYFDLPLIYFATKECIYKRNKQNLIIDRTFEYSIKKDRFTKKCTIEWEYNRNSFEIMLEGWYDVYIEFNYIENEPTIRVSYKNLYTKEVVKDICNRNDYSGEKFIIYLLLEDDRSFVLDSTQYSGTYYKENGLLSLEYELDYELLFALTKSAIAAIKIINQDGEALERDTEPYFFDLFKKYATQFAEAIRKCDSSVKIDVNSGNIPIDSVCYVYLMHDIANGYYKIGISKDPQYRERTLQSEKPTIEKICAKEFPTRQIAEAFEAALHKTYAPKRIRGEWFNLTGRDVVDLRKALS